MVKSAYKTLDQRAAEINNSNASVNLTGRKISSIYKKRGITKQKIAIIKKPIKKIPYE